MSQVVGKTAAEASPAVECISSKSNHCNALLTPNSGRQRGRRRRCHHHDQLAVGALALVDTDLGEAPVGLVGPGGVVSKGV